MSPRRSSRARNTQPPLTAPVQTNSSTSSISSGRAERNTRSNNKTSSPRLSNPRSQSIDDVRDSSKPLRRTRSGHDEIRAMAAMPSDNVDEEDGEDEEEEEVTRCVCGQTEYPGLPSPTLERLKQAAKEGSTSTADIASDDVGGMFIQCDVCKVWQHGGCVGIFDDSSAPDEYFCEQCKKDLHKVATSPSGQRYSLYLPLQQRDPTPAASPQAAARERTSRRSKGNKMRTAADTPLSRRRHTMNSRDIYDEEEDVRRAIEESKRDGATTLSEGSRKNKRSRSDSEETKEPSKRQRTGSNSGPSELEKPPLGASSSDEALAAKAVEISPKKPRGVATRNNKEKGQRDLKEPDRQKAFARRKGRAPRRRGDESDTHEDATNVPPPSAISTPPTIEPPLRSQKKGGRPGPRNGRRVGRNQYTRDRDPMVALKNQSLEPNPDQFIRTRSRSRSNAREQDSPHGGASSVNGNGNGLHDGLSTADVGRPSKPKHMTLNRTSMNEMKRRVAAILEFVNKVHDDGQRNGVNTNNSSNRNASKINGESPPNDRLAAPDATEAAPVATATAATATVATGSAIEFTSLTSDEMMKNLRERLVLWENEFGRYKRN